MWKQKYKKGKRNERVGRERNLIGKRKVPSKSIKNVTEKKNKKEHNNRL